MSGVTGTQIVRQDLESLFKRLNDRMEEAMRLFAQKRSREHFKGIFFCRYKEFSINVIEDIDPEVYPLVSSLYEEVDGLFWYLKSTEDMPSLVRTKVDSSLKSLNNNFANVMDYFISHSIMHDDTNNHEDNIEQSLKEEQGVEVIDVEAPPPFFSEDD